MEYATEFVELFRHIGIKASGPIPASAGASDIGLVLKAARNDKPNIQVATQQLEISFQYAGLYVRSQYVDTLNDGGADFELFVGPEP